MTVQIAAVAALGEPARKALYDAVRSAGRPLTREEAATATGVSRKLAAFHLDKLVAVGLLITAEPQGPRRVGRAPKAYEINPDGVQVSIPPRAHANLASIMLEAISGHGETESVRDACHRIAADRGALAGETARSRGGLRDARGRVRVALSAAGYEPYDGHDQSLRLRNCPFHPLADEHPDFVCSINGAFLTGLLRGVDATGLEIVAQEPAGQCCAEIRSRG